MPQPHRCPLLVPLILVILLACFPFCTTKGQTSSLGPSQKKKIDQLFREWNRPGSPGAAIGLMHHGRLIHARGYGEADLEHQVPIDAQTVFYMASVSKHFVSFCILMLEERGQLGLDDRIQKFLPDFPEYEQPLTIRHFIHHTSGVRDHLTLWTLAGNSILDHIDQRAIYDLIKRQKNLNFQPGEKYLYSNSCYFLLTKIVEKTTGLPFRVFAEREIFKPLGMKNTRFHDDVRNLIRNRAFSYSGSAGRFSNLISRFDLIGSGGLYSNIEDMARWEANLLKNRLGKGSQSLIDKLQQDGILNNGTSCGYAFGLINGKLSGRRISEHGGALLGYRTHYLRFPDQEFSVVVLANVPPVNPGRKARQVAAIFFGDPDREKTSGTASTKPAKRDTGPTKNTRGKTKVDLDDYVGAYYSKELDTHYLFQKQGDELLMRIQNRQLSPRRLILSEKDLWMASAGNQQFAFSRDRDSKRVNGFTLDAGRVLGLRFEKQD